MKISMGGVHPRATLRRMGWIDRGEETKSTLQLYSRTEAEVLYSLAWCLEDRRLQAYSL